MFPKSSEHARHLLDRLLKFNPNERLTAAQALQHEYLKDYRNPEDEPIATQVPDRLLDFEYEEDGGKLRRLLYHEVQRI